MSQGLIDRARVATDENYKAEMRWKAQTDLLWLARLLGYNLITDEVHGPVAFLCVLKDPSKPIEEQNSIKQTLHLDPRGSFKSTMSIVDSVQWIICFPNVRICKITATKPLATAIVGEITDHFVKAKEAAGTDFQVLFPEFCISPRDKRVGEYTAPCRTREWREATVMSFSIETSISGWHFDVIDPDDPVDNQNSSTDDGLRKVKKNWKVNKKTLMPWGYVNFKGTRYHPFDLWGDIIDKATPGKIKTLIRGALKKKDGSRLEPGEFPQPEEVELLFPALLSYEFLKSEFEDDYETFMSQYMNDSQGGNEVVFSKEQLLQSAVTAEAIPPLGQVFIAWRFAYNGKPTMKNAGAAVGVYDGGRMYIVDVVRGSFKPSVLAHRIVLLAKKHGTHNVTIEETPGAKHTEAAILNYGLTMGWPIQINWLEFQEDDGVRDSRIKSIEPLLASGRLLILDSMKESKHAINQLNNYGMIEDIEIPDAISRVAENVPKSIVAVESDAEQDAAWELMRQRDLYDRTHGVGRYAPPEPVTPEPVYQRPRNSYGLDDMLGGLDG